MAGLAVVHEEFITRIYRAPKCSAAFFWRLITWILSLAIPLAICILTQGMWKKTNTYLEQPKIEFTKKCFFLVASSDMGNADNYYFWSSYQDLNQADPDHLVMPVIQSQQIDRDNDGKPDEINVDVALKFPNTSFHVQNVFYQLQFNVFLAYRAVIEMKVPLVDSVGSFYRGSKVNVFGDLQLLNKKPLPAFGTFATLDSQVEDNATQVLYGNTTQPLDVEMSIVKHFPQELLMEDNRRNHTLHLYPKNHLFIPFSLNDDGTTFTFSFRLFVREQVFTYKTTAMELFKWFWLQYFSIFILTKIVLHVLSAFLYENQILATLVFHDKSANKID